MVRQILLFSFLFQIVVSFAQVDYSSEQNWAALPTRQDQADWVPEGLTDGQSTAEADVFFIHPTTKLTGWGSNADIDSKAVNSQTDNRSIRYEASVFNGSCKVYAPRYRQASLHNFFKREGPSATAAFDLAYSDVKAAFEYYLKNYNNGRPIIVAGHSQGSMHAVKLLKEFFDGTPLQSQLVAAYIIGWPVKRSAFQQIPVADSATQLGAFISYNTFGTEADPGYIDYRGSVCVNPLSWKTGQDFVSSKSHLGGISKSWKGVKPNLTGCKCASGMLQIQKPGNGYIPMTGKNYHIYDYLLFYGDIRANVAQRVQAFLQNKK